MPAFTVAGLRIRVKAMSPEIPELWGRFVPRIDEIPEPAEPNVAYGLMDDFDEVAGMIDYMAGVSVAGAGEPPAGMSVCSVPAGTYAVFETTIPTIGETMGKVYGEWLPSSGYRQAAGPSFERYGETFNPHDPGSTFSIYVRIEKAG